MGTDKSKWPQPNEYWRMRNGGVIGPLAPMSDGRFVLTSPDGSTWTASGNFYREEDVSSEMDLIERVKVEPNPHPEPRRHRVFVAIVAGADGLPVAWRGHDKPTILNTELFSAGAFFEIEEGRFDE